MIFYINLHNFKLTKFGPNTTKTNIKIRFVELTLSILKLKMKLSQYLTLFT